MFRPRGPSGQTIRQTVRGQKKSISAPARSRTMGTGLMKSPTPAFYGDVPSLSPPVDWIMPKEDAGIVGLHTPSLQYSFIICKGGAGVRGPTKSTGARAGTALVVVF